MGTASSLGSGRCGDQQPRASLGCRSDFHHTELSQLLLHPTGSRDSWERSRPQHRPPGPRLPAPRGREPAWLAQLCSWGRLLCGSALLSPSSVARGIAMTEKSTVGGGPGAPTPPADVVNCGAVQHPGSGAGGPLGWDPPSATLPSNSSTLGHPEKRHWGGCAAGRGKDDESQERMLRAAGTRKDSAQPMMLINDSLINKGLHARVMGLCQSCGEGSSAGRARWHRALKEGGPLPGTFCSQMRTGSGAHCQGKATPAATGCGRMGVQPHPITAPLWVLSISLLPGFPLGSLSHGDTRCWDGTDGHRGPLTLSVSLVNYWELWQLLKAVVGGRMLL